VTGLNIDKNVVRVSVMGAATAGSPARCEVGASLENFNLVNMATTVAGKPHAPIRITRNLGAGTVEVKGQIPVGKQLGEFVTLRNPALAAASCLTAKLRASGIAISGEPVTGVALSGCQIIATHRGKTLAELVKQLNKH